jgi:hypothetical protein
LSIAASIRARDRPDAATGGKQAGWFNRLVQEVGPLPGINDPFQYRNVRYGSGLPYSGFRII